MGAAGSTQEWQPRVQVPVDHYKAEYEDWDKWLCYYWQIRNVFERKATRVLEIGVGSKVVTSYLRRNGIELTTLDIDPALDPDYVGSVTQLPFGSGEFDAVLCTEVLEHMPFEQSQQAILEIARVSKAYAFVTVPHFVLSFAVLFRLPVIHLREFRIPVPYWKRIRSVGEHFWECGKRGYPVSRLRRAFKDAGFKIISEKRPPTNYSSCFFVLRKLETSGTQRVADAREA
jgi:hypothetical protein